MRFSYQAVVLATLAFESALAQPSHRQVHQHKPRGLADVLGKRVDYSAPGTYLNPATGKAYTAAEWACLYADNNSGTAVKNGKTDAECQNIDTGSSTGGSSPATPAPAIQEKVANTSPTSSSASSAPASGPTGSVDTGSSSDSGPGAHIFNKGSSSQTFIFYPNDSNDFGQNSAPGQSITLAAGADKFVSLPLTWKGHVQRGIGNGKTSSPSTWAEFQVQHPGDNKAWGDISLQKGCDGAAKIIAASDPSQSFGFTNDIISGAPDAAKTKAADGSTVLDYTTGGWAGPVLHNANPATIAWEQQQVGQAQVYIVGGSGTQVVQDPTNAVHIEFY